MRNPLTALSLGTIICLFSSFSFAQQTPIFDQAQRLYAFNPNQPSWIKLNSDDQPQVQGIDDGFVIPLKIEIGHPEYETAKYRVACSTPQQKSDCMVDTGSAHNSLPDDLSAQNKINIEVMGYSGQIKKIQTFKIPQFNVGETHLNNLKFYKLKARIGMDFFKYFGAFEINVPNRTLSLGESRIRNITPSFRLGREKDHLMIEARSGDDQHYAKAMFDTGAELTAVKRQYIEAHREDFEYNDRGSTIDANGVSTAIEIWTALKIKLGQRTFINARVIVYDFTFNADMIIGSNIINKAVWTFNLKENTWSVTRPSPLRPLFL